MSKWNTGIEPSVVQEMSSRDEEARDPTLLLQFGNTLYYQSWPQIQMGGYVPIHSSSGVSENRIIWDLVIQKHQKVCTSSSRRRTKLFPMCIDNIMGHAFNRYYGEHYNSNVGVPIASFDPTTMISYYKFPKPKIRLTYYWLLSKKLGF